MRHVIEVANLSKQYQIGSTPFNYSTLRDQIANVVQIPLTRRRNGNNGSTPPTIWALKDVSFEVQPGEVVGVVGRNGSGKSTLLRILSRITEPTLGTAQIHGRSASLLEIGTGFHPELTGRENTYLNGAILGMSRSEIKDRFDEIVAFAEIEDFIETPVKRYSSGMYLRLAFAVAAHLRTEILFLDEVLAVGDTEFQRKCLGKVEGVAKEGRTVIFVSHNLGAVTQLCPRVLWLNDGRLQLDGTAREVVSAYASQWRQATHSWQRSPSKNGDESNKEMSLLSVRLRQPEHEPDGVFSFDLPFTAEIAYELLKPTADLRIAIRVVSESGTIIFTSSDQDKPVMSREGVRHEGRYISVCRIPGSLLRPGKFFLSAGISCRKTWIELHENLLMFEISAIGNPLPDRLGIISPVLDWEIQKLA